MTTRQGPGFGVQCDDHIWVTWVGGGWAIRAITRPPLTFHLWRGYWPDLEFTAVEIRNPDWPAYCERAAQLLAAHDPLNSLLENRHAPQI